MPPKKPAKQPAKKVSGSQNLLDRGLVSIQVPMTNETRHRLKIAAAIAGLPTNQFILEAAVKHAEKVIRESK